MALLPVFTLMSSKFDDYSVELSNFLSGKAKVMSTATDFTLSDECLLEGLLSRSWQEWAHFCRSVVVLSCTGSATSTGVPIVAHPNALSPQHVGGAAAKAKKTPAQPTWGNVANALRNEVTWGDTDVLATILPRMNVPRHGHLLAAFSQAHESAKAIQTIRNAAAHFNAETMADVVALSSRYVAFQITHPTQALFWTVPASGDYLFRYVLDDLKENASIAIS